MTIDASKIKAGDTVRVRYQNAAMAANGIPPYEYSTVVYDGLSQGDISAGADRIGDPALTILEHTPARPDWADALVIQTASGPHVMYIRACDEFGDGFFSYSGTFYSVDEIRDWDITVVLDADGNPPTAEVEWLDADALDKLPMDSVTLGSSFDGTWPRWKGPDGSWRGTGVSASSAMGYPSRQIAPARVLWVPEVPF